MKYLTILGLSFLIVPSVYAGHDVEKGIFTRQAGTGNQTVTLTDGTLTPKAVIFYGTNQTSEGFAGGVTQFFGYMVNATQQRA